MKTKIAITIGDPAGIGSELILKALNSSRLPKNFVPILVGSKIVLEKAAKELNLNLPKIECIEPNNFDASKLKWGEISEANGRLAAEAVILATKMALAGEVDAIVTAPINKEAIQLAGYHFPGHTELLAKLCGTEEFAMMLAGEKLKVVLVTTHLPLGKVSEEISTEKILSKIQIAHFSLKKYWRKEKPKIAVCALNPHGGEHGLFGHEEARIIEPAVKIAQEENIDAIGPLPSDTLFAKAQHGEYDAVICMYHDQALIPLKMVSFGKGVNITLGLPIIRTSVDHGTAFDIAGQGVAGTRSKRPAQSST
jgi:4-phospho-D-threonate 3-dehydrogenase / 4-phospho-D-erythronate 3-dehydrogenase